MADEAVLRIKVEGETETHGAAPTVVDTGAPKPGGPPPGATPPGPIPPPVPQPPIVLPPPPITSEISPVHVLQQILAQLKPKPEPPPLPKKEESLFQQLIGAAQKQGGLIGSVAKFVGTIAEKGLTGPVVGGAAGVLGGVLGGAGPGGIAAMGALGAAFPTIGIAMAAIGAVTFVSDKLRETITGAIHTIGSFASAIASPDANPATLMEKVGGGLEALGAKIPVLGIFIGAVGAATSELGRFMRALDGLVDRYAQYSPALATAQAINEIRQVFGDIRRAQQLTPQLVNYLRIQGDMQQKFEDIKVKLLLKILPIANELLQSVLNIVNFFENLDENMTRIIGETIQGLPFVGEVGDRLVAVADNLRAIREEAERLEAELAAANNPVNMVLSGALEAAAPFR